MDIDLPHHFVALREQAVREGLKPKGVSLTYRTWSHWWESPRGYRRSIRLARLAQRLYERRGRLQGGPGLLGGWTRTRDMPPVARETFGEWWERQEERRHG